MRKKIALLFIALLASALYPGVVCAGTGITLRDSSGRPLKPDRIAELSISQTCGECHDERKHVSSIHFSRNSPSTEPESVDCLACHDVTSNGTAFDVTASPSDNACLSCHPEVQEQRSTTRHAHAGISCVSCHRGAGHRSLSAKSCTSCHAGQGNSSKPVHRGVTQIHLQRVNCTACHSSKADQRPLPHSVVPTSAVAECTNCHNTGPAQIREAVLKPSAPWVLAATVLLCGVHFTLFRPKRPKHVRGEPTVMRFGPIERLAHGTAATSFLFLAATGAAFFLRCETPDAPWRAVHGHVGALFAASAVCLLFIWRKDAKFIACDAQWLRRLGGYLWISGPCPAGKFNAGQKLFFWIIAISGGALISLTGVWLSVADGAAPAWVFTLHDAAALLMLLGIAGHIYLSLFANPGSLKAIVTGRVPLSWARRHHSESLVTVLTTSQASLHTDGTVS